MAALIRTLAIAAVGIIALSFIMFAVDEIDRGSKEQQIALGQDTGNRVEIPIQAAPSADQENLREKEHSSAREAIDDADDILLNPFAGVVQSNSNWVTRGVPTLIGLFVYGIGLGLLANFLPKPKSEAADWRTA